MSELPPSWAEVQLSAITVDASQRVPLADEVIRYIDIGSVNRNTKSIEFSQELLGKDAPSRARKQVAVGDTLVSMTRPNLNAVALVPKELDGQIASTGFDVLRPVAGVDPRWISYLVRTEAFVEAMSDLVQGALYPAVRSKDVRAYGVPLAPQAEQTRIANQLDTLLTRVQACNDRFDAIPALLKRFRQNVLDACLLDDQLAVSVEKSIQPWALRTVGSVCVSISDGPFGSNLKSADYTSAGVQVVRLENIGHLFFDAKKETFISAEKYKTLSKHTLKKGDLLFSSFVDEEVRVCEFPIDTLTINKADCFRLRVDETQCNRHFLLYRLACKTTYQSLKAQVHGATRPRINLTQLRGYEILLPPLAKQAEIVRRVEALFALADRIEAHCTAARTQAQRLTPLVLAKAFRGELVPQDPNDEPASELLARMGLAKTAAAVKAEKKASTARKQAARKTVTA